MKEADTMDMRGKKQGVMPNSSTTMSAGREFSLSKHSCKWEVPRKEQRKLGACFLNETGLGRQEAGSSESSRSLRVSVQKPLPLSSFSKKATLAWEQEA